MCGIAGILSKKSDAQLAVKLIRMIASIGHRGPDGEGFVFDNGNQLLQATNENFKHLNPNAVNIDEVDNQPFQAGLAHRRLSIIDISTLGHQPMKSLRNNLWITYNGEIYNYIELRDELTKKGYQFRSRTDTEVVLAAYEEYGADCLDLFDGMFSFVIYNPLDKSVFAARDRLGVKPFYYTHYSGGFAFASEIKALLTLPIKRTINPEAVLNYFAFSQLEIGQEGFIKNIFELKPSHYLHYNLSDNQVVIERYYQFQEQKNSHSFQEAKEKTTALVENSIQMRMRADVPLGVALSGGIDSSIITGIASKSLPQLDAFTVSFNNSEFSEQEYAQAVVEQYNLNWHQIFPNPDHIIQQFEDLIYHQEMPVLSTNVFSHYLLCKSVNEVNIPVLLEGQGADELFAGYNHHIYAHWQDLIKQFAFAQFIQSYLHREKENQSVKQWIKKFMKHNLLKYIPKPLALKLIQRQSYTLSFLDKNWFLEHKQVISNYYHQSKASLEGVLINDFFGPELKQMLKLADRNSMAFGIESRIPFADSPQLMNYALNIPSKYKIKKRNRKYILREAFKDILPSKVYLRDKKLGFPTPTKSWVKEMKEYVKPYLDEHNLGILNTSKILNNYEQFYGQSSNYKSFSVLSFAIACKILQYER